MDIFGQDFVRLPFKVPKTNFSTVRAATQKVLDPVASAAMHPRNKQATYTQHKLQNRHDSGAL